MFAFISKQNSAAGLLMICRPNQHPNTLGLYGQTPMVQNKRAHCARANFLEIVFYDPNMSTYRLKIFRRKGAGYVKSLLMANSAGLM